MVFSTLVPWELSCGSVYLILRASTAWKTIGKHTLHPLRFPLGARRFQRATAYLRFEVGSVLSNLGVPAGGDCCSFVSPSFGRQSGARWVGVELWQGSPTQARRGCIAYISTRAPRQLHPRWAWMRVAYHPCTHLSPFNEGWAPFFCTCFPATLFHVHPPTY